jgi:hypothetical protein
VVVSPRDEATGFREQRGEDDTSDSWQRCEYVHVALLVALPRLALLGEGLETLLELSHDFLALPVEQA